MGASIPRICEELHTRRSQRPRLPRLPRLRRPPPPPPPPTLTKHAAALAVHRLALPPAPAHRGSYPARPAALSRRLALRRPNHHRRPSFAAPDPDNPDPKGRRRPPPPRPPATSPAAAPPTYHPQTPANPHPVTRQPPPSRVLEEEEAQCGAGPPAAMRRRGFAYAMNRFAPLALPTSPPNQVERAGGGDRVLTTKIGSNLNRPV